MVAKTDSRSGGADAAAGSGAVGLGMVSMAPLRSSSIVAGGAGFGVGAAFYITGTAPEGFRFSVDAAPGFVTAESSKSDATAFMFNGRAMLGYNWVWHSGFTLGLNAGIQYFHMGLEDADISLNGVLPALDFNLGFVF